MKRLFAFSLALLLATLSAITTRADDGTLKLPPFKKVKLKNGMTILLMEQHEVPLISFNVMVKAGSVADPAGSHLSHPLGGLGRHG